jgi:hypothetical protein
MNNPFQEPGELQNLFRPRENALSDDLANKYCLRTEFILDILDRHDVPQDLRDRAARILKLSPAEVVTPVHEPEPAP